MSTTEPTQTAPAWTPTPAPVPRKPVNKLLVALIVISVLAIAVITTLAITTSQQHGKAVDARSTLADTRSDLKGTEDDLETTQGDLATTETALTSAQGTIDSQNTQLAYCAGVVEMDGKQFEGQQILLDALSDTTDLNFTGATDKINQAGDLVDEVTAIIEANGFEYIDDMWAACDPANGNA